MLIPITQSIKSYKLVPSDTVSTPKIIHPNTRVTPPGSVGVLSRSGLEVTNLIKLRPNAGDPSMHLEQFSHPRITLLTLSTLVMSSGDGLPAPVPDQSTHDACDTMIRNTIFNHHNPPWLTDRSLSRSLHRSNFIQNGSQRISTKSYLTNSLTPLDHRVSESPCYPRARSNVIRDFTLSGYHVSFFPVYDP